MKSWTSTAPLTLESVHTGDVCKWVTHSVSLIPSSAPLTKPWTSRNTSAFATMPETSRESLHFALFAAVFFSPRPLCGDEKHDGLWHRVHKCKPHNHVIRGQLRLWDHLGSTGPEWQRHWAESVPSCKDVVTFHHIQVMNNYRNWLPKCFLGETFQTCWEKASGQAQDTSGIMFLSGFEFIAVRPEDPEEAAWNREVWVSMCPLQPWRCNKCIDWWNK